ncbi:MULTISPECIES: hypothetical protein [unclassified Streptomyces]|uniref:hypothetical protein n=1 Tax=unclassified Streptomyces TaxID=2593676 RepID=UPI00255403EA|nr:MULTISPECIES: hypothetical protein [unclassified Streptomyces]WRZ69599.1 hypothetical protein OG408_39375 [Streptomyces sp. NBC_01257]WSU63530.1 hypothetical protein OG450_39250 [Streptomyces sp. NBC_01104]
MLRSIAITLATVAAAGFVAAAPAVANDSDGGWEGGKVGAGYSEVEADRASAEYLNLGGPYGVTYAKAKKAHFEGEAGYFYAEYLQGR